MVAWKGLLGVVGYWITREKDMAVIDDMPFRLQYIWTTALLFVFQLLLTLSELIGESAMSCWTTEDKYPSDIKNFKKYANFLCWVGGTTVRAKEDLKIDPIEGENIISLSYLQWMPYVLVIQGIVFYIPRLIWLSLEEGKLNAMLQGVTSGSPWSNKSDKEKVSGAAKKVVQYLNMTKGGHYMYGMGFIFCQVLLVLNVIFCIWFNNQVLDHKFLSLGVNWAMAASFDTEKNQALAQIFPLESNCNIRIGATGGKDDERNMKCLLPPNVLLQYIIVIIWFWYAMLLVVNVLNLALVVSMLLNSARVRSMYLLRAVGNRKLRKELKNDDGKLSKKIKKMEFGKYLFLYFVARSTPWRVSNDIMLALKGYDENSDKTEKMFLGAPPQDEETHSQVSLPPYSTVAPRKNANKKHEESIDMPDIASTNERPQSMKSRRVRSRSNSPTKGEEYLMACLNDN